MNYRIYQFTVKVASGTYVIQLKIEDATLDNATVTDPSTAGLFVTDPGMVEEDFNIDENFFMIGEYEIHIYDKDIVLYPLISSNLANAERITLTVTRNTADFYKGFLVPEYFGEQNQYTKKDITLRFAPIMEMLNKTYTKNHVTNENYAGQELLWSDTASITGDTIADHIERRIRNGVITLEQFFSRVIKKIVNSNFNYLTDLDIFSEDDYMTLFDANPWSANEEVLNFLYYAKSTLDVDNIFNPVGTYNITLVDSMRGIKLDVNNALYKNSSGVYRYDSYADFIKALGTFLGGAFGMLDSDKVVFIPYDYADLANLDKEVIDPINLRKGGKNVTVETSPYKGVKLVDSDGTQLYLSTGAEVYLDKDLKVITVDKMFYILNFYKKVNRFDVDALEVADDFWKYLRYDGNGSVEGYKGDGVKPLYSLYGIYSNVSPWDGYTAATASYDFVTQLGAAPTDDTTYWDQLGLYYHNFYCSKKYSIRHVIEAEGIDYALNKLKELESKYYKPINIKKYLGGNYSEITGIEVE
ncbi:MAG: hypothetical protein WC139_07245 [Candidatus Kapaibacterium sp.]